MSVDYTFMPPDSAPLDPGAKRSNKPKVLVAEFGDGFSQRARDGINHNPWSRSFSWTNLTKEEKDYIDQFFEDRGGVESFYYQKHDEAAPRVYICTDWDVVDVAYDIYTVSANFKQVYDVG